jgi:hypothetical protein
MLPFLLSPDAFAAFLHRFDSGTLPRAEWSHAAHLAVAAATVHAGGSIAQVRHRILTYNAAQGIVSTPTYGYHETITQFWVVRLQELLAGLGRGATAWDAARAAVATFAHRGRVFDHYYSFDIVTDTHARAVYVAPDK